MLCRALAAFACFFFLLTWIIEIAAIWLPNWWLIAGNGSQGGWASYGGYAKPGKTIPDPYHLADLIGMSEGLWSSCLGQCYPTNQYSGGCLGLLNVVRAFSIMTIIFGFITCVLCLALAFCMCHLATLAMVMAILTVIFSLIPWAVYIAFVKQCVMPYVNFGSGWGLCVGVFCLACLGLICLLLWCILCRPKTVRCPPMPCPCPMPCSAPMMTYEAPMTAPTMCCAPSGVGYAAL